MKPFFRFSLLPFVLLLLLGTLSFTGCAKNAMGPSAPEAVASASSAELTSSQLATVAADCKKFLKPWNWKPEVPRLVRDFYRAFLDSPTEPMPVSLKPFFENPVLKKLLRRFKVDELTATEFLQVLTSFWDPDPRINPLKFTPSVTLAPRDWQMGVGFYGPMNTNWTEHFNGMKAYQISHTNPDGDHLDIVIGSAPGNMILNESNVGGITFECHLVQSAVTKFISSNLSSTPDRATLNLRTSDGNDLTSIAFDRSSVTKQGSYEAMVYTTKIYVHINLQYQEDGSGTGFAYYQPAGTELQTYNFVFDAQGIGYWTLNGGVQHPL